MIIICDVEEMSVNFENCLNLNIRHRETITLKS
jgi:hypothetical protein